MRNYNMKGLLKNIRYNLSFLAVFNSPFRGLKLKWYFGDIEHGTPYFLPRRWVKCNKADAHKAWAKLKVKPQNISKSIWINTYGKHYTKAIPIKYFGFHFTSLGWKTKWEDYRFEWSPSISLVIFGKQLFILILPNVKMDESMVVLDCYWEAWLTYYYNTDKTKPIKSRLEELKQKYSCNWGNKEKGYVDYYSYILKEKYESNNLIS